MLFNLKPHLYVYCLPMFEPLHWKRSQYFKQVFKFLIQLFHTHTFQSHWRRMTAWFSWFQSHCGSWQPDLRFIEMLYEMFISIHAIHSTNPWFQSHCGSRSTWNNWIHLMMELTLLCGIQHGSFFIFIYVINLKPWTILTVMEFDDSRFQCLYLSNIHLKPLNIE